MDNTKEILDDLRQDIDCIDNKLITLLKERSALVRQVGERKKACGKGGSFIRPGREAVMLRDLMEKIGNSFPKTTVAAIWRMIISGSLSIEQPMRIAAYYTKTDNQCYWLAREYFGAFLPMTQHDDIKRVVLDVKAGNAAVGVIPSPLSNSVSACWWLENGEIQKESPRIFATIPFVKRQKATEEQVLAIADVSPEPSGDDTSILAITIDNTCSQERLVNACSSAFNTMKAVHPVPDTALKGKKHFLVEIAEFITDDRTDKIRESLGLDPDKIHVLGAYANPIIIKE